MASDDVFSINGHVHASDTSTPEPPTIYCPNSDMRCRSQQGLLVEERSHRINAGQFLAPGNAGVLAP
jgi:hypothetical protein